MSTRFGLGSRSLEIQLLLIFGFITAILGWIAWASYFDNRQYRESEVRINQIHEQLRGLNRFMLALQNSETSQRGYLLTDKPEYLEPYEDALRAVHLELERAATLLRDEPSAANSLEELRRLKSAKLDEMGRTIVLSRSGQREDALAVVMTDAGKTLMDSIQAIVADLQTAKRAEIAIIQEASTKQYAVSEQSLRVFLLAIVSFMLIAYIVLFQDLTERRRLRQRIRASAHTDALTGLPNFLHLNSVLANALKHAYRDQVRAAAIVVDLDDFQGVNDRYGFEIGDRVLKATAERLREMARRHDLVARLSGDVFVMIAPHVQDIGEIQMLADRIVQALTPPILPEMHDRYLGASIGIALYPDDGVTRQKLLIHAQQAVRLAKSEGKRRYRFFSDVTQVSHPDAEILHALHRGIERGEFALHYQPQVDMQSGNVIAVEALLRWSHPERGSIPPDDFLPIAERSGLIVPLGSWILHEACRQAAGWKRDGLRWRVAVNVSAIELASSRYPAIVREALDASGLDADLLDLEVTERALLDDTAAENLRALSELGVHISLDDFGTGYSSLSYLARFPVRFIKIDKSFMAGVPHNETSVALVRAVIQMAHALGIDVIAEGVENISQIAAMRSARCWLAQGYYFYRPLAAGALAEIMRTAQAAQPPAARSS